MNGWAREKDDDSSSSNSNSNSNSNGTTIAQAALNILCLNNVARYICAHTIRNNDRRLYAVAAAHHIDKYHFMSPKPYNAWANGHRNRKRAQTKPGGRGQSIKTEYDHVSGCARERSCNLYCITAMCTYIRLSAVVAASSIERTNKKAYIYANIIRKINRR